ncbi:MAG: hypothetical protein QG594_840 [Bacteroidota bacterium]|nr:hypothetical protein [Bacteroidota bacterium]
MENRGYVILPIRKQIPMDFELIKTLDDNFWIQDVFFHLLKFYKDYNSTELKNKIKKEKLKTHSRIEREVAKYIRKYLNNDTFFSQYNKAFGEVTNDEDVEGNYDVLICNTLWGKDFHFECKNLDLKSLKSNQNLICKYVFYQYQKNSKTTYDGGVYRYFNGKYAQNQNFGGMLGFILDGDLNTIKEKIIEKLKVSFDEPPEGDLIENGIVLNSIENNDFTFSSIHKRFDGDFTLYHILLDLK